MWGHLLARAQTEEGEVVPHQVHSLTFGADLEGGSDQVQPIWPLALAHRIDRTSPLWALGPRELAASQCEVGSRGR